MSADPRDRRPAINHDHAQIGDVRLHYATAGTGEKLVLLLHGFPECWYAWRHQITALSDDYTVVAPDLRGCNLSDKPPRIGDYKIEHLVDDVIGLIRHFKREKAAVIGHDWGGGVAWAVGLRRPESVWKLAALQAPPPPNWKRTMTLRQFRASWYAFVFQVPYVPEWLIRRNDFKLLEDIFRNTTAVKGAIDDADIAFFKEAMSQPGALSAGINYYRANLWSRIASKDDRQEWKVTVPTLFIYGEKDRAILPSTVTGVKDFVDAPYTEVRIPQSAHWVQQEAATEVTAALKTFLAA